MQIIKTCLCSSMLEERNIAVLNFLFKFETAEILCGSSGFMENSVRQVGDLLGKKSS